MRLRITNTGDTDLHGRVMGHYNLTIKEAVMAYFEAISGICLG
jgi:hypothetical protein